MIEIERKFLVDINHQLPYSNELGITQGYLNQDPERTVRIRITSIKGFPKAYITVKGKSSDNGLSRFEWEMEIPVKEAKAMLELCTDVIDKRRFMVPHEGKVWEIDVFLGDNEGLIVAEVELVSVDEPIVIPPWVTKEVTGISKYYNSNLGKHPYKNWLFK